MMRLRTRRDGKLLVTIERLKSEFGPQRSLRNRNRDMGHEIILITLISVMRGNSNVNVKITGGASPRACSTALSQPKRRTRVNTSRHVNLVRLLDGGPALTPAGCTRSCNDFSQTRAARTSCCRHHLPENALSHSPNLAGSIAVSAGHRLRSRSCT